MDRKDFMKLLGLGSAAGFLKPTYVSGRPEKIQQHSPSIYPDANSPAAKRAKKILKRMTFSEKLEISGGADGASFPGIKRLGLRSVKMSDASQGVRTDKNSTAFPPMQALASTWNPDMAKTYGSYIAEECRALGIDILLGPAINICRNSEGGRNYEYMGEDPLLTSKIATNYVKGLQSQKVIATVKHFIANNQEMCRQICSSDIGERALHEIYLPAWKAVIQEGDTKAIMTGNNSINGVPCSINKELVAEILRNEYGFTGITMTDWQNTSYFPEMQGSVLDSGESLLMPRNTTFSDYIKNYIKEHPQKKAMVESKLEKMIFPNLLTLFEMGVYDREGGTASFEAKFNQYKHTHQEFARKCGEEAICLLKNEDHILPLESGKNILMMGTSEPYTGGGSGHVAGYEQVSYPKAFKNKYGSVFRCEENPSDDTIRKADVVIYRLNKKASEGKDIPFEEPIKQMKELMRCAALNPNFIVVITAGNGMPMPWLNKVKAVVWANILGQERGNALVNVLGGEVNPSGHLPFTIEKSFNDSPDPNYNIFGGKPYWKGANEYKKYFLGEVPNSTTRMADYIQPHQLVHVRYIEGVFVGYRWYDYKDIEPQFPFGHGLSYTTFKFSKLTLSSKALTKNKDINFSFNLENTGGYDGAEVIQLYARKSDSNINRPVKELKGFKKIFLKSGDEKKVNFALHWHDLSYWNTKTNSWKVEPGGYEILIGSSSHDIHSKSQINIS